MSKFDIRTEIASRIIALVEEQQILPWQKPWNSIYGAPKNAHSNKPYRGANVWLLNMACHGIPLFLTYKQAAEHGGRVKPGEKGYPVAFFTFLEKEDTKEKIPMWRHYTVFSLSQCEKVTDTWDAFMDKFKPGDSPTVITSAQSIHDAYKGPTVNHGGDKAFYSPSSDTVVLPDIAQFNSVDDYHLTRFHEEVHSTGHKSRIDRKLSVDLMDGGHSYSYEELVAELGGAMLAGEAGLNIKVENSAAYISNWLSFLKNDLRVLFKAAGDAQKATDMILGKTHEV